jgi:predicted nucleotide-binding protein (sugar kinase/HSP70/actin superfamily)
VGEWMKYISYRHIEDAIRDRKWRKVVASYIIELFQKHDEHSVVSCFRGLIDDKEPSIGHVLAQTKQWLSPKCGSEAVLSIGVGIDWMESPAFAGVISVMPHGCMPGGIVAAMSEKFTMLYKKPWINLTYDGFRETNNLTKINNFAEIIRFCNKESKRNS